MNSSTFGALHAYICGASTLERQPLLLAVNQAAAGYGNTGLLTVMFLYCVAEGEQSIACVAWQRLDGLFNERA